MHEKFYPIPNHDSYGISVLGTVIDYNTGLIADTIFHKKNYVKIGTEEIEIAKLVLSTFVGEFPASIEYLKGIDSYDTRSVQYSIIIHIKSDDELYINGIIFKKLKNYNNYYISKSGVIYFKIKKRFLIKSFNHRNYPTIALVDNHGKRSPRKVHRLVYETFIGDLIPGMIIDHINGKKWCSESWNLEQVTYRENVIRAYETGLNPLKHWNDDQIHLICSCLEKNYESKKILKLLGLEDAEFKKLTMIIHLILHKSYFKEISMQYNISNYLSSLNKKDRILNTEDVIDIKKHLYHKDMTIKELSNKYNCTTSTISKIRDGKTWKRIRYRFNE